MPFVHPTGLFGGAVVMGYSFSFLVVWFVPCFFYVPVVVRYFSRVSSFLLDWGRYLPPVFGFFLPVQSCRLVALLRQCLTFLTF
jgi:hypothetical protein